MKVYEHGNADFEWMVGLNRYSLKVIGCWPEATENERLKDIYVIWIILLVLFGNLVPQIYALTMVINELPLIIDNALLTVALTTAMVKLTILWRNKKQLMFIMASIKRDCLKWKEDWERNVMLSIAKQGRLFTICGYFMLATCVSGVLFGPMIGLNYRIINNITDIGDRILPTQSFYPFDYSNTPYFEITYTIQVLSLTFASFSFISPVALFGSIVYYSCGQLSILGSKVNNLSILGRNAGKGTDHTGFSRQLKWIVDTHTRIIRIVTKIESTFKNLVLAQVITLSIMICCIGFQILNTIDGTAESPPITQVIFLSMMFSTITLIMFVFCLAGETLAYHCEQMHRKIYEVDWYCWQSKDAMVLVQIMIRTKDHLHLSAGQFFFLNFQAFTSILKSSAGYISMLIAVRDK